MDFTKLDHSLLGPARRATKERGDGRHFVQIYHDDASLVSAGATFMSLGLESGASAVVIAGQHHIDAFEEALGSSGVDLQAVREEGRWRTKRSHELLSTFMVNGMPVPSLFVESLGGLIRSAGTEGKVRIFGEMVADLWADGRIPAAMRVEELWNDLASTFSIDLFCAYPASAFRASELMSLMQMCRQHTQVIPPTVEEHW